MTTRAESIGVAGAMLKQARKLLGRAGAPQARAAVARALKSVEGAARHASRGLPVSTRRASRPAPRLFLLVIEDDVEPQALRGPFRTEAERVAAARAHRVDDREQRDGLYRLDVSPNGRAVRVSTFVGWETDPDEEMCRCGHVRRYHAGQREHGACEYAEYGGARCSCRGFTWMPRLRGGRRPASAPQLTDRDTA